MSKSTSVDQLIRSLVSQGIHDDRVLSAMRAVPRNLFVRDDQSQRAYEDAALPIECGQTISQPYIVALMTQALQLTGEETVLEVGTGSGYQTAVLSQLCRRVVSVERHETLAESAKSILSELQIDNVTFRLGDGTRGCREFAPYDGILVAAATPSMPRSLANQLGVGGRIVIPVGDETTQTLILATRTDQGLHTQKLCNCRFVKLIGREGWSDQDD